MLKAADPDRSGPARHPEVEAELRSVRPWRNKVRSAERGQEIVQCRLVRQVDDREAQAPLVVVAVEQVIIAHAGIKQVSRVDAGRIVIVVLRSRRRYLEPCRPVERRVASDQWSAQRRENAAAKEASLHLLVRAETREIHRRRCVRRKRNSASHKPAVVAPSERHPWGAFQRLVLHVCGLLKVLVVIDAEHGSIAGA